MSVRPGELLIASALLRDGVFDQTVVLVLDSDEDGSLGVVLNRLSEVGLTDALPDWDRLVSVPRALFYGGPVSRRGAICLASLPNLATAGTPESASAPESAPPGWRRLFGRVGLLHLDTPTELIAGAYRDLRIFAGYAGWARGQLEAELEQGMWHQVPGSYTDIFGPEPTKLWRQALRRQPSDLALFATWVPDPEVN